MGWSVQVPSRKATERDEAKIAAWKDGQWPVIKRRRRTWAPGSASRTKQARAWAQSGFPRLGDAASSWWHGLQVSEDG
ncbi:winged helix-turn-helix domain-containing protein [Streptomyces sp. NPDC006290]|uniref:winged helix-turn-helix domain-containing protein n=1 Tax=Streptomyces sp. NPDC006290 TaxID=3156745 RepID=UPI00339F4192